MYKINGIKRLLTFAAVLLLSMFSITGFAFCPSVREGARAVSRESAQEKTAQHSATETQTVLSYKDVFASYYRQAEERMAEGGIEMPYTFDEFCDGYYELGMDIQDYTDLLVNEAFGLINMSDYEPEEFSSKDEDYIIGKISKPNTSEFDPEITPASAFERKPKYVKFDYSAIHDGDIIIETDNWKIYNMGHAAMVYNAHKRTSADTDGRGSYIQTIEAVQHGVQFGFLDDTRMIDFGVVIIRSTVVGGLGMMTLDKMIENAKYFMWKQLGKPYSLPTGSNGRANMEIDSTTWYCTELVNAAYAYGILNLDAINDNGCVWAYDLIESQFTKYVCVSNCLDVDMLGKEGGKWKFRVYNSTDSAITFEYNKKLAFYDDAKNWSGLKDKATVSVGANSSTIVYVSTNVFATTAAFSRVVNGTRCITYCYKLNTATMRMRVNKNII